jgi:hypothetical protein
VLYDFTVEQVVVGSLVGIAIAGAYFALLVLVVNRHLHKILDKRFCRCFAWRRDSYRPSERVLPYAAIEIEPLSPRKVAWENNVWV